MRCMRSGWAFLLALCLLLVLVAAGFLAGSSSVSASDLVAWLTGGEVSDAAKNILMNVRLPRVLAAVLAGAALAVAGALLQAALDNPLASPNVIGINSGAGLFVLLAASLFPQALWMSPVAAFAGALVAALFVFAVSMGVGGSRLMVVLSGMAITTVFGAGMDAILIVNPDAYVASSMFLVGGLSGVLIRDLVWPAIYILIALVLAFVQAGKLNVMALGDDAAHALGVNVGCMRIMILSAAALLAGASVSFAGLLGFVGLVVPHIVRFLVGTDNRVVLPLCAILGAAFVTGCDLLARVAFAPYELPVGIVMAFLGGPFFIYLIVKNRRRGLD